MAEVDASWGQALIACAATFILSAVHSTYGFFYVAFMREFNWNREKASWPTSVSQALTESSALITVALQRKFPISTIGLIGSILCWSGIVASQWATNISWMTFTFGLLQGAGSGIVAVAVTVLLMRRFDKYRATATGIRYCGYSFSSLFYPPVLSRLYGIFSLSQMFLLLGGMSLNLTPLVYTLREPSSRRKPLNLQKRRVLEISKHEATAAKENVGGAQKKNMNNKNTHTTICAARNEENKLQKHGCTNTNANTAISALSKLGKVRQKKQDTNSVSVIPSEPAKDRLDPKVTGVTEDGDSKLEDTVTEDKQSPQPRTPLLFRPGYWVVVFGAVVADYSEYVFLATMVDSALDRGATTFKADMSIACSAPSQLLGRTILPFLADVGFTNRTTLACACYFVLAASISCLGMTRTFTAYAPCAALVWISLGCLTTMKHVVAADHFGVEAVPAAWATTGLLVVPVLFCNPSILGFFRDKHGSYNNLYYCLGSVHFVMGVVFLLLRCLTLKREKTWNIEHQERNRCSQGQQAVFP